MSSWNHTAARLLMEQHRFAFARPWANEAALSVSGVCPASDAVKPQTGTGISRGDPAP